MQFGLIYVVSALLFLSPAAAVNIEFYTGPNCAASGKQVSSVKNAKSDTCYPTVPAAAASVSVTDLPFASRAQAYNGRCQNFLSGLTRAGTVCLSGHNFNVDTANWYSVPPPRAPFRRTPIPEPRFSVTYEQPGGALREVEVPSGHYERALGLVVARDYNALGEFPTVSFDHVLCVLNAIRLPDADIMMLGSRFVDTSRA